MSTSRIYAQDGLNYTPTNSENKSQHTQKQNNTDQQTDPFRVDLSQVTLKKLLGKGSYGSVYLCKINGKETAIKSIRLDHSALKTCENEKNIMRELTTNHAPNVVAFYGFAIQSPNYYIFMEYAVNGTLEDFITNNQPIALNECYTLLKGIICGIEFLHSRDIIHRDIKDSNILLDANREPKLTDFGLSQKESEIINARGSAFWMAPELFAGKINSKKSDIFSFGVVAWQVSDWSMPNGYSMDRSTFALEVASHAFRQPISANCEPRLAQFITWCWNQDPKNRPTAKEAYDKLTEEINTLSNPGPCP